MYLVQYSLEHGKLNGKLTDDGDQEVEITAIRGYFKSKSKKKKALFKKLKKTESDLDYTMVVNVNFNYQRIN